jgi:hypothetical protein
MTREITSHKVSGCNDALKIEVLDAPGAGGACHLYHLTGFDSGTNPSDPWTARHGQPATHSTILFQNGPVPQVGTNGVTHEALLAVVADRLRSFQYGPYACIENANALACIEQAMGHLHSRTLARVARGVEGTHAK